MSDQDAKRQAEQADKKFTLTFTKRELTIIFNVLAREDTGEPKKYRLGDAIDVLALLHRIEPYIVVDSNIPEEKIVTSRKVDS